MMWQLMWRNVRATALNATLRLLVIYRYRYRFVHMNAATVPHGNYCGRALIVFPYYLLAHFAFTLINFIFFLLPYYLEIIVEGH